MAPAERLTERTTAANSRQRAAAAISQRQGHCVQVQPLSMTRGKRRELCRTPTGE